MAAALDQAIAEIQRVQNAARKNGSSERPRWPMIILRSPKGWTCPKEIDGKRAEGSWRSHQVPMGDMDQPGHVHVLEEWLRSYRPEELFDESGRLRSELAELAPTGEHRMSANPHANGGAILKTLRLPAFTQFAVDVAAPGGEASAWWLVREPAHPYDLRIELWLDPAHGYWPVRLRQTQVPGGEPLEWILRGESGIARGS